MSGENLSGFDLRRLFSGELKMTDSQKLLAEYVKNGSETAFHELVTRYINLVYSTALRLVNGDAHQAQDVTQSVFADFAGLAHGLPEEVMLGGWLHRHTCFVAATVMRGERRRKHRERQAVEMNALNDHTQANLAQIAPVLDEAINRLGARDRAAILLRFFEQRDWRAVGEALGSNDEAARKRVSRALDKLHTLLKHHGVTFSAAALATALASEAVTAAPAGLAIGISGTALAGLAVGGGTSLTLARMITMTKLKFGVISTVVVVGAAVPLMIQHQSQIKLREENHSLRQEMDQLARLKAENQRLSNLVARANRSQVFANGWFHELLRLRGEVGGLRNQKSELEKLQEKNRQLLAAQAAKPQESTKVKSFPKESWAFAGYATPEATIQTVFWASSKGNVKAMLAGLTSDQQDLENMSESEFAAKAIQSTSNETGFSILNVAILSNDAAIVSVSYRDLDGAQSDGQKFLMKRIGSEWKLGGDADYVK